MPNPILYADGATAMAFFSKKQLLFITVVFTTVLTSSCFVDVPEAPEALAASDCLRTVGPFEDPNALRLGAVLTLSGSAPELGQNSLNALIIATEQINQKGIGGKQNARPLAFRVCDDRGDSDHAVLVASYLTTTLGPAAIVGPAQSRSVLPVAEQVAIPTKTLLISGSATAQDITDLDDQNLVWRTAPPDNDQPNMLAFFSYWQLLEANALTGNDAMKIALVNAEEAYAEGFAATFRTALQASADIGQILTIEFVSIPYQDDNPESVKAAGQQLREELPQGVLLVGSEETADILEEALSDPATEPTMRLIPYFMPDGTRTSRLRTLFTDPDKVPRLLFGVNPGFRNNANFGAFFNAHTAMFSTPPGTWSEHVYDAVYLLAIAAASVDGEPTGATLAEGLMRVNDPAGRAVNLVPGDLLAAFNEMGSGGSLDIEGASGPLDFDNSTGEPLTTGLIRWNVDGASQTFVECGLASIYYADNRSADRFWCPARCKPDNADGCFPNNAP